MTIANLAIIVISTGRDNDAQRRDQNETNYNGFTTVDQCIATLLGLREWVGLEELNLTNQQIADIKELDFDWALKCRWNRELASIKDANKWQQELNKCIETKQTQRNFLSLGPFNATELDQMYEDRYTLHIEPFIRMIWNYDMFQKDRNGNHNQLKSWLDQGGNVTITDLYVFY